LSHTDPRSVRPDFIDVEALESRRLLAAVKVMPVGDSITSAFVGDASYRFWLDKQLDLGGYDVDIVGSHKGVFDDAAPDKQGAPRYLDFDQDHEGFGGVRTDQILADLPRIVAVNVPDVVLLHAGSNDMFQSYSVDEAIANLGRIIDGFRAVNPRVTVLVAQVIPSRVPPGAQRAHPGAGRVEEHEPVACDRGRSVHQLQRHQRPARRVSPQPLRRE
jgi:lysophospholipase L1-like esterase